MFIIFLTFMTIAIVMKVTNMAHNLTYKVARAFQSKKTVTRHFNVLGKNSLRCLK